MFGGNMMFLLFVVAAIVLLLVVFMFFHEKSSQGGTVKKGQDSGRNFTEDDRQAVLLIQELGDIISEVEKTMDI